MAASTLPVMSRALDSCSSAWSGNMDRRVSRFASPPPLLPPPLIVAPAPGVFFVITRWNLPTRRVHTCRVRHAVLETFRIARSVIYGVFIPGA